MAGRNSIIKAIITADTKGFDSAIGRTDSRLSTFGRNAGLAIGGVTAGIAGAVAIGKPLVDAASTWEESASRVDTIFGDASGSVRDFADTAADTFAVSGIEALTAAGDFAGFFESLGGDELADMSTDLVAAAADFASFNDLTTEEALGKFRSALAGSSEVVRQYGIDTSAAAIKAKALELGLGGANRELTEQEKNLARSAILLDESNTFMGDFERTSGTLANQQKQLAAKFSNVQVELGQKLLPVAIKVAEVAVDLIDGFSGVIDVFSEKGLAGVLDLVSEKFAAFDTIREVVGEVAGYIVEQIQNVITIFDGIIDFIRAVFTGEWGDAWEAIKQIFTGVWDGITAYVSTAWELIKTAVGIIVEGVKLLWDWSFISDFVGTAIDSVVGFFTGLPERLGETITTIKEKATEIGAAIKDGIVDGFKSAVGFAQDLVSGLWGAFKDLFNTQVVNRINDAIPNSLGLGPFSVDLPDNPIPQLAAGGIVTGPTLALIGEAGPEAIVPLSGSTAGRYGFGGGPQMVHVSLEVDGRVLAEVVRDANVDYGFAS